jgi:hypothetical protein
MTQKERIDNLESELSGIKCVLDEIKGAIVSSGVPSNAHGAEPSKVKKNREMTPGDFFNRGKKSDFSFGPVPMDSQGRITDPSWSYDSERDVFVHTDDGGEEIQTVKRSK